MQRNKNNSKLLFYSILVPVVFSLFPISTQAQTDSVARPISIAVFAPLYLDSAFDASGNYRHGKTLPKYFNVGLEFYEGIQLAIDSLEKENIEADIHIYDTRSAKKMNELVQDGELQEMDLFIGYVNVNEAALLARAAATMQIPFVNINLPNDAGVKANPNYIILNPTLGTHCTAIYKYLQKNHPLSPIIYFRKKGPADDRLKTYFTDAEKATASVPLKMRYITLEDTATTEQLRKFLDSNKTNICIAGSLDLNFGLALARQISALGKSYKTTLIGMPTWDQVDLTKSAYRGVDIIYSSSLYVNNDNQLVQQLQHHFKTKYFTRAADIIFSGFESLYYFTHLLDANIDSVSKNFGVKKNTIFGEIDIQPVVNKQTGGTEYYENKKLYFIRKADGVVKAVN